MLSLLHSQYDLLATISYRWHHNESSTYLMKLDLLNSPVFWVRLKLVNQTSLAMNLDSRVMKFDSLFVIWSRVGDEIMNIASRTMNFGSLIEQHHHHTTTTSSPHQYRHNILKYNSSRLFSNTKGNRCIKGVRPHQAIRMWKWRTWPFEKFVYNKG